MSKTFGRKSVAFFLASILVLSACGDGEGESESGGSEPAADAENSEAPENFNAEGFPIVNEPITLKMMGWKHPIQGPWEEMVFFKEMEKMTNIKFEFDTPPAEGFQEKKNLAFASGEVPDVFFGGLLTPVEEVKYGDQGVLIPLDGLIEKYAPNIQKMFEEMPEVKQSITAPDGHIYSLPNINKASIAVTSNAWINGDWLQALNITELPDTTEEFYAMLKRFQSKDPNGNGQADDIPLSTHDKTNDLRGFLLPAFGELSRDIEVIDGEVRFGATTEGYKQYLAFMNRLWNEKLIDQDAYSQGFTEMSAKGKANKVGVFVHAGPFLGLDVKKPEDNLKHPTVPALTSETNPDPIYPIGTGTVRGTFSITSENPYPEATIRWVDHLYSLEGSIFLHYGPENDLWEFSDEAAGLRRYKELDNGMNGEEYRGTLTPDVGTPTPKWVRPEVERGWDDVGHEHRFSETEKKLFPYGQVAFPLVYYTVEESERLEVINTDLGKYVEEMEAKFITGVEPLGNWQTFVDTLKKMGVDELVEINKAAYDRWVAAK